MYKKIYEYNPKQHGGLHCVWFFMFAVLQHAQNKKESLTILDQAY